MLLLRVFEFVLIVFSMWFALTQVVLPLSRGTKMFPAFREEGKLEDALTNQRQQERDEELRSKLKGGK